jgi:hypothetical protein
MPPAVALAPSFRESAHAIKNTAICQAVNAIFIRLLQKNHVIAFKQIARNAGIFAGFCRFSQYFQGIKIPSLNCTL